MLLNVLFALGQSSQDLRLLEDEDRFDLNPFATTYFTPDTLKGDEALVRILKQSMQKLDENQNPGMTNDQAYWIRFGLSNNSSVVSFFLEVDYPQLDYLQLYEIRGDSAILLSETGDIFPFDQRPVQYRNFVFPLLIEQGSQKEYLLNVDKRSSAVRYPLTVYSEKGFWKMYNQETIFYGFCFGLLSLVTIISVLAGIRLKMNIFTWYSLYVFTFGLRCFAKLGYGYQYLISDYPEFNTHFFPLTTQLASIFLIMYIKRYFSTEIHLPRFNTIMNIVLGLFISSTLLWAFFTDFILRAAPVLIAMRYVVLVSIIAFAYTSAIKYLKIEVFRARIFLLGYSVFFLGIISQILVEYGAVDDSIIPVEPLFLGFFIEIGVFSYAMIIILLNIIREKQSLSQENQQLHETMNELISTSNEQAKEFIKLKSKAVLDTERIKYIQSDDHYLEFHIKEKERPEIDRNNLSTVIKVLPPHFIQIHRSTIVNLDYVQSINNTLITLSDGTELNVSRSYKKKVEDYLRNNK